MPELNAIYEHTISRRTARVIDITNNVVTLELVDHFDLTIFGGEPFVRSLDDMNFWDKLD